MAVMLLAIFKAAPFCDGHSTCRPTPAFSYRVRSYPARCFHIRQDGDERPRLVAYDDGHVRIVVEAGGAGRNHGRSAGCAITGDARNCACGTAPWRGRNANLACTLTRDVLDYDAMRLGCRSENQRLGLGRQRHANGDEPPRCCCAPAQG